MTKWLIVPSLLLPGTVMAVTVWMWVDADGQRHYSDRPVAGAQAIELDEVQGFSAPPVPDTRRPSDEEDEEREPAEGYERLTIAQPEQTETLWNIEGTLDVRVDIAPPLREGHVVDLYLDGERQHLSRRALSFTVEDVYRGVHSLEAVVLDSNGEQIMRSPTRNFVVQQTSLLNPNNPRTSPPGVN